MSRRLSVDGLELLKKMEGLRLEVYADEGGLPTIGHGHLLTAQELEAGTFDRKISMGEAEDLLLRDVRFAEDAVSRHVRAPMAQNQYDALVLFVFNVGVDAFMHSTLLRKLNAGDHAAVPAELARWNKIKGVTSKGLSRRRAREAALWSVDVSR